MADTRDMLHCHRTSRPCTCRQLTVYDRDGRIALSGRGGARCLPNSEVCDALTLLIDQWQRRFHEENRPLPLFRF